MCSVLLLQDLLQSCSRGGGEDVCVYYCSTYYKAVRVGHVLRETTSRVCVLLVRVYDSLLLQCLSFSVCREFGFIAIQMRDKNPTLFREVLCAKLRSSYRAQ